jgi:hypothetical protein
MTANTKTPKTTGAQRRALRTPAQDALLRRDIEKMGGDIRVKQVSQWVTNLFEAARLLQDGGAGATNYVATTFWLRLWGTLAELDEYFQTGTMDEQFKKWGINPPLMVVFVEGMKRAAYECIGDVRRAMSKDEVIYAEYRRQVEAHPFQDSFRHVHNRNKSGFRAATTIQMLGGEEIPVADADAAIVRVITTAKFDELQIAVTLAKKLAAPLAALHRATTKYATATDADFDAFRRSQLP